MDNFTYFYEGINHNQKKKSNKLLSVADNVSSYSLPGYEDLKPNLSFIYSSAGQRIGKVVKPAGSAPADWDYTYYILDAQGNTMSTYNLKGINIYQDRIYLYGSSRLGELVPHKKSNSLCGTLINDNDLIGNRSAYIESFLKNVFVNVNNPNFTSQAITFWINHWDAYFHVHSNQFSVEANNMATHQFMWNEWVAWLCKLNRFETLNEQIFSLWDAEWQTRMEPFISHQINCSQETCPEMYQNLLPLWRTNEELMITAWEGLGYTNNYNLRRNSYVKGSRHYELSNHTSTMLSAGLGNVLTVVSDRKIEHDERYAFAQGGGYKYENGAYHLDAAGSFAQLSASDGIISHYTAELISATDYYAFGAPLPERSWQGGEYRYGFNGQERDDEVVGAGNIMTAEFWMYDARLGRRWNLDPINRPLISNYSVLSNSPITRIDPNGKSDYYTANGRYLGSDGTKGTDIMVITDRKIIKNIDKLSYETIKVNPDAYVVVNVSLTEDSYFKLPSYEERRNIEKEINKVDYSDGKYYEIGGSKSNEGVITQNEGNKMNVQEIGKIVDEYQGKGTPTTLTVDVGSWDGAEYTWHLHPDKTFIEKTTAGVWQLLSSDLGVKTISGNKQYFGGYELSDLDMNLTHSKNNFLMTKSGKDVIRFNNTSSSNTRMDRSFFYNSKAREVPNKE